MGRCAESLARETSTKDIKGTFKIFPIESAQITIDVKLIHPTIFLALAKNILAEFTNFYTGATLMSEKFSTIYSSANSGEQMKFLDSCFLC